MRKITWLGMILGILIVLSLFVPQSPRMARAAPGTESLWSQSNSVSSASLELSNSGNADGSTTGDWAAADGGWTSPCCEWWEFVMEDISVCAVNSVTLYLTHYQSEWVNDSFSIEIYDGTTWLEVQSYNSTSEPPGSNTTNSWDVKALGINTWTKINAAKVRISGTGKTGGEDPVEWFVDTVELRIDYTPASISITVTDGNVAYGTVAVGATEDTTASGVNDTQTATNMGNVAEKFQIKSSNATGGTTNWTLESSQGDNTFTHKASTDGGSTWNIAMNTPDVYVVLKDNVAVNETQTFDLQIGMPTSITDYGEPHTITVTVLATAA